MKVYYSINFTGHWPVGTSAIVVARNEEEARKLLDAEIKEHGLKGFNGSLVELELGEAKAIVLQDGEY